MEINYGDPNNLNRTEFMYWLRQFLAASTRNALIDIIEQHGLEDKIKGFEYDNFIKDTTKVQFKSTNTRFFKVYFEELNKMFDSKKIDALDVGYLTLLGKYVDYEDNTLKNDNGSYITTQDIMEILKISDSTVKRFLKRMADNDIILKQQDENDKYKRKMKYFINPHILYKGRYIDKQIKQKLNEIRKEIKEIDKNEIKFQKGKQIVVGIIDKLQELDYTDMSKNEIDSIADQLKKLAI